jgi:8-oxo-dGTP pyrophosphatase MutT (NUDIX family)
MSSILKTEHLKPDLPSWDPVYYSVPRKPSAVAVIIFESDSPEPSVLFIRRSTRLGSHRGQVGFPGGRMEAGDKNPRDTALREAAEEVGLRPEFVNVLGATDPLPALDGSLVYPIIATTEASRDDLQLSPSEVADIYMVPIRLVISENRQKFEFNLFGCWRRSFLYNCGTMSVWGLSAEILAKADLRLSV